MAGIAISPNIRFGQCTSCFGLLGDACERPAKFRHHREPCGGSDRLPYALVKLTPKIVDILAQNAPRLSSAFTDRRPPGDIRFGIGDIVSVTIFEAAAGGLFIPSEASVRPGNFITLPNQSVDAKGNISIPYAGVIQAKGRTPVEVQQLIVDALKNRAIEPQVVISMVDQRTSMISVLGEVNRPERFPASPAGEHLLDAITRAGGPKAQGFDTWVMLERDGHRATVPFGALVYEPSNNIFVRPNDTIYLYSEPQTLSLLARPRELQLPRPAPRRLGYRRQQPRGNSVSAPGGYRWPRVWRRRVELMTRLRIRRQYFYTEVRLAKWRSSLA